MKRKMASSSCINELPPMIPKTKHRKRRSASSVVSRTSIFRGVTRHRLSGRFEAHLWDKNFDCINKKKKKGKQSFLFGSPKLFRCVDSGAYDDEVAAARTYDLAALKHWGPETILNFEVNTYKTEMEEMKNMSNKEFIAFLRRKSSGFSRGASKYRGVARHHHNGRWEARLGRVNGNKYIYLGTYATQEEAAKAYDLAALEYRGAAAVTNFHISHYYEHMNAPPTGDSGEQHHDSPQSTDDQQNDDTIKSIQHDDEGFIPVMENLKFEQDNPWSLSMELGYTTPHVFPNDPFDGSGIELDMFNDHGYEANIDSIFSKPVSTNNGCGFRV